MTCPNCYQAIEDGADFCGNCGQPLQINAVLPAAAGVPGYALAKPGQHAGETKALLALILGIAGIAGALFIALIGLVLGTAGIILGTMSRSGPKRGLSTAGLVFSSLAILASLAVWTYAVRHDPRFSQDTSSGKPGISAPAVASSGVSTPCYSAGFVNRFNVSNNAESCDMNAFNGTTLNSSSDAYKVYADTSQGANARDYADVFKPALEKDIKNNLPGFAIDTETAASFAGSPAYIINAHNKAQGVAIVEAAVLHKAAPGENVFILVHAVGGGTADLTTLEAQWQWK